MTTQYQTGDYVRIHDHDGAEITVKITDSGIPNRQGDFTLKAGARMFKNSEILGLGEVPVASEKKFEIGDQVVIDGDRRAVVIDIDAGDPFPYRVHYSGGHKEWVSPTFISQWNLKRLTPAPDTEVHADLVAENDVINSPAHYTSYPVEVIELTEHMNFCRGNAVKYISRAGLKDPAKDVEDLRKAVWYLEREITRLESK